MSSDSMGDCCPGPGGEVVGARDLEAPEDGLPRHAVPEVDHVVHDRGITGRLGIGNLGIGRGEDDVPDGLQRDAVMPRVEPDQRLSFGGRTVGSRMDVDGLVDGIPRRRFQRVLYPAVGTDVIAGGFRIEADGPLSVTPLSCRAKPRTGSAHAASRSWRKARR